MPVSYSGDAVFKFDAQGLYLDVGMGRGAVRVPVSAIAFCSQSCWEKKRDTNLWIEVAAVQIAFPDNESSIINWCREQRIKIVDRSTAYRLMNEKRAEMDEASLDGKNKGALENSAPNNSD